MCSSISTRRSFDASAWAVLAAATLAITILELRRPLPIDPASTLPFLLCCAPLAAIAFFYHRIRRREQLAVTATALIQVLAFSALGCILQYLLARSGGAMWDARLAAWDKALGLDWLAFVRWVDAHPAAAVASDLAYKAMIPETVAVIVMLGFTSRLDQLRAFVLAGMLCGAVTILISPEVPSVSSYVFLGLAQEQFHHIDVIPGYRQLADLTALRAGTFPGIRLPELQGIIAFPSYHAGLAVVNAWGFWNARNSWLSRIGLALAVGTIVSAPVNGGHYFVDVLAGVALGCASIPVAKSMIRWSGVSLPLRAWPSRRSRAAFAR